MSDALQELKDRMKDNARGHDWIEDFDHENGTYMNRCSTCSEVFTGHKRRYTCKLCATGGTK